MRVYAGYAEEVLFNAYCTHRAPPEPTFPHVLKNRRDRTDAELVPHLKGFMGFVMQGGKRPMSVTRYQILRHIERVQNQWAIEVATEQLDAFAAWALESNALVFAPDGTVRAPDGAVLVDPETGEADPEGEIPFPRDALERRARTEELLDDLGIHVPMTLPPVVSEVEVELRSPREVAERIWALLACAMRAESLQKDGGLSPESIVARVPLAPKVMSPRERAFFDEAAPGEARVVEFVWRYESVAFLAWALGVVSELSEEGDVSDVGAIGSRLLALDSEAFVQDATLRPVPEILDALDRAFRLHWAVVDARQHAVPPPMGLNPGVVTERHYAGNWLTQFENADWDHVQTPT